MSEDVKKKQFQSTLRSDACIIRYLLQRNRMEYTIRSASF